jgi:hypothetical protein
MKTSTGNGWKVTTCTGKQAFETAALASKVAKLSASRRTFELTGPAGPHRSSHDR